MTKKLLVTLCVSGYLSLTASLITNKSAQTIEFSYSDSVDKTTKLTLKAHDATTAPYSITNPRITIDKKSIYASGVFENPRVTFVGTGEFHTTKYENNKTETLPGPRLVVEDQQGILLNQSTEWQILKK